MEQRELVRSALLYAGLAAGLLAVVHVLSRLPGADIAAYVLH